MAGISDRQLWQMIGNVVSYGLSVEQAFTGHWLGNTCQGPRDNSNRQGVMRLMTKNTNR